MNYTCERCEDTGRYGDGKHDGSGRWIDCPFCDVANGLPSFGCAVCGNKVEAPHEGACTKRGYRVAPSDCYVPEKQEKQK